DSYRLLFFVWPDGALSTPFNAWTLEMYMRAVLTIGLGYVFVRLGMAGGRAMLNLADLVGCRFMRLKQKSGNAGHQAGL
ncbi:MAG TPA: hypothetical protein VH105_11040, partial [Burkholderiales bacterium]|nr:hypothetical protein [Burkholderiales bacterium]